MSGPKTPRIGVNQLSYPRVHAKRYSEILAVFHKIRVSASCLAQLGLFKASASKKEPQNRTKAKKRGLGGEEKRLSWLWRNWGRPLSSLGRF
jgi:hypothetical protein